MKSTDTQRKVPQIWVERAALGELRPEQERELAQRSGGLWAEQQAKLLADNEEILRDYPVQQMAAKIEARARKQNSEIRTTRTSLGMWGVPALAACTLLVLWQTQDASVPATFGDEPAAVTPGRLSPVNEQVNPGEPTERSKGLRAHLAIFRREDARAQRLQPNQIVKQGDVLQLAYVAAGRKRGVIVSIDGRGQVTTHFPDSKLAAASSDAPSLVATQETSLANAYELDDAPEFERFIFVTADGQTPLAWNDVVDAAHKLVASSPRDQWSSASLQLPPALEQSSFILRKSPRNSP